MPSARTRTRKAVVALIFLAIVIAAYLQVPFFRENFLLVFFLADLVLFIPVVAILM